jgi:hypothetical protein
VRPGRGAEIQRSVFGANHWYDGDIDGYVWQVLRFDWLFDLSSVKFPLTRATAARGVFESLNTYMGQFRLFGARWRLRSLE